MIRADMLGWIVQPHSFLVWPGNPYRITKAASRTGITAMAVHRVGASRRSSRTFAGDVVVIVVKVQPGPPGVTGWSHADLPDDRRPGGRLVGRMARLGPGERGGRARRAVPIGPLPVRT